MIAVRAILTALLVVLLGVIAPPSTAAARVQGSKAQRPNAALDAGDGVCPADCVHRQARARITAQPGIGGLDDDEFVELPRDVASALALHHAKRQAQIHGGPQVVRRHGRASGPRGPPALRT